MDGMRIETEMSEHCGIIFFLSLSFFIASPMHTFQYLQQTDTSNRFLSSHFLSLSPLRERREGSEIISMSGWWMETSGKKVEN